MPESIFKNHESISNTYLLILLFRTFWEFYKLYPELARTSVSKLDGKIKSVLEDHSTEVIGHKVMFDQSSGPSRTATRPPPVGKSSYKLHSLNLDGH